MLVSDYILKFLSSKGVNKVFLITGGAIAFVVDAFSRNKKIKYVSVAHEQAAAMMADSYSRLGPNFGATMVTSGPGATNLLTGIACSWFDSIPNIHICGQVNTYETSEFKKSTKYVRQVGFQETDIVSMAKPITKFAYRIKTLEEIPFILEKAYQISVSGRPGPVLIDIPMNFQRQKIILNLKKNKLIKKETKHSDLKYLKLIKLIKKSKRPSIILGGAIRISNSITKIERLLKEFDIPILTTWSGLDSIGYDHKNYIGTIGVYGNRAANFTVQNSDLVLNIGSRLDTRITGGKPNTFAREAKIISVDIDKNELFKNRGLKNYDTFNCDLNIFLEKFIKILSKKTNSPISKPEWMKKTMLWKKKYPTLSKKDIDQKKYVNPYFFIDSLSKELKKDDIVIADDGAHLTWAVQAFKIKYGQRFFSAWGNSPMGYAFPAAIGASIAKNRKKIICLDGDGSIQMNLQELHTLKKLNLPIKIFVLNNNGYGIIKQFQEIYLGKRYEATVEKKGVSNPNFEKICKAFGIKYIQIKNHKNLKSILKKVISSKSGIFVDVLIKPDQKIVPKLEFGRPIEDLSPKLSDKDFEEEMVVKTLRKSKQKLSLTEIN
jgi:acetolactate synthase-1/2/3 large subunit